MVTTVSRNHSGGPERASVFTGVGLTSTSTGPATSVMLDGWARLRSSASTATAASTGTHGWQTAMTCERGPSTCRNSTTWSTSSSSPNGPCSSPTSRALCQSVTWTSWSGSMVRTVSVSRVAKCPDSGATTQHARLGRRAVGQVLGEPQQRAERGPRDDLLVHGTADPVGLDDGLAYPEGEPLVGDRAVDEDLVRGAQPADGIEVGDRGRQQVQRLERGPRHGARAVERDALRFVRGIQHADSPDRPRTAVERCAATSAITR